MSINHDKTITKKGFAIKLRPSNSGDSFWMEVGTTAAPWASASTIIDYPNIFERLCGITVKSKLEKAKNKLFKKVLRELEGADGRVVTAIEEFYEENK